MISLDRFKIFKNESLRIFEVWPEYEVVPDTEEKVSELIRECNAHRVPVLIWGWKSNIETGNVPTSATLALNTTKLNRIIEFDPQNLSIVVEAGVKIQDLQKEVNKEGLFLPVNIKKEATVGGLVASNYQSYYRTGYGSLKNWVLGMRVVYADGTAAKSGGKVMKNVAGYNLKRMHIGAYGSLGIITQLSFKLAPVPEFVKFFKFNFKNFKDALDIYKNLKRIRLNISALELFHDSIYVQIYGYKNSETVQISSLSKLGDFIEVSEIEDVGYNAHIFVPRSELLRVLDHLYEHEIRLIRPETGEIYAFVEDLERLKDIRTKSERSGGQLIYESLNNYSDFDSFSSPAYGAEWLSKIKDLYDPNRILNPGRFVNRI